MESMVKNQGPGLAVLTSDALLLSPTACDSCVLSLFCCTLTTLSSNYVSPASLLLVMELSLTLKYCSFSALSAPTHILLRPLVPLSEAKLMQFIAQLNPVARNWLPVYHAL
jgi:hypothetical protein